MSKESVQRPLRVGLISLGCAKNLVDAELMLGSLLAGGIEITNDSAQADVMIVNTCSFIDAAQEESVDTILESAAVRESQHRGQGLIVSGCLSQRFREQLPTLLPEVDVFMGIDQVPRVAELVKEALARRQAKMLARKSAGAVAQVSEGGTGSHKAKLVKQLARLDAAGPKEKSSPGSLKPGKTKTLLSGPGPLPVLAPLLEVDVRPRYIPDYATPRFRLTPRHFAYVKIAEGCNHPCSFCVIPRMRGSHRSRAQSDLVSEARALLADGVKELNLISQDSTYYGLDLRPGHSRAIAGPERFGAALKALPAKATTICTLLRELNELPGDFWLRLLYTHPAHWSQELIETIGACSKVARYIDIPLQHIHQNMLERMRRETSQQYIVELLQRLRAGIPGVVLRTTFIVGFPGETEEYFQALLRFIQEAKFERLGVFTYSQEEDTRAGAMAGQIPEGTKQRRRELAMATQHAVAEAVARSFVGRTLKVLVEQEANARQLKAAQISSWEHGLVRSAAPASPTLKGTYLIARGEADAPDIDGRIYVRGRLPVGEFAQVKIVGHTDYDLIGQPI